ncbi:MULTISPECIES: hypothetical protein [unclassified Mesorhizobium]|uniref:hypothetical protein n=1 Tax=unclassified Mesorhizobium TaxID=325217 RepID=UPI002415E65F|nr:MULTISPECIES: hypothetical protein [unclassified Mesorhizobium]WFP61485.1 hypothetical protein QAZ47_23810 [Mesorhizobium sp. WSM4904]WFP74779.1 hypothetical protein QAZ22_24020 [Mesorhizobium sp. WSM4906]
MLKTILAASALTIGLATAAMAQNAGHMGSGTSSSTGSGNSNGTYSSGQTVAPDTVDPGTTGSITGGPTYDDGMNSNADRNCAAGPQGAQPDASNLSPGTTAPTVNDKNCGK